MLLQSDHSVVYKVRAPNGLRQALTRLVLPDPVLHCLSDGVFEAALLELKGLKHPNLRSVIDGGQDEVDQMPWVTQTWWDGESLEDRIHDEEFGQEDADLLENNGRKLIGALGARASALSFRAREIIVTVGPDHEPMETFNFDVLQWFLDWAMGFQPGFSKNADAELDHLVRAASAEGIDPHLFRKDGELGSSPIKTHELPGADEETEEAPPKNRLIYGEPVVRRPKFH